MTYFQAIQLLRDDAATDRMQQYKAQLINRRDKIMRAAEKRMDRGISYVTQLVQKARRIIANIDAQLDIIDRAIVQYDNRLLGVAI